MAARNLITSLLVPLLLTIGASANLPPYNGTYGVGVIDVEVPVSKPQNLTDTTLKSNGQPAFEVRHLPSSHYPRCSSALQLQTVLFTLFYPISESTKSSDPPHFWLTRPIDLVANGIVSQLSGDIDPALVIGGLESIAANLTIPAQPDVDLLSDGKFPVIVFSHGDASLGTWYSMFNGEIASNGAVVAVMQHRDGSSPGTQVNMTGSPIRNVTAFSVDDVNPKMNDTEFRIRQRDMRQAELEAAVQVLQQINSGDGDQVYKNNSRGEGQSLSDWKGRLDFDHLFISGHSFGAASALQALDGAPSKAIPANAGVVYDPGEASGPLNSNVPVPIAIVNSEELDATPFNFSDGQSYFDLMKGIAEGSLKTTNESYFMTLGECLSGHQSTAANASAVGSIHVSITDLPLITTNIISFFDNYTTKTPLAPTTALSQLVNVTNEFIAQVVNGTRTGVIAEDATHAEYKTGLSNDTVQQDPWEIHVAPGNA